MIFRDKISELQLQGYAALRIADFWQRKIARDGEDNAEQFYRHLGLNHIEKKGYEWEGLTLSREPKEHEKIAVKGIANAQESAFESINKILLALRTDLIAEGLKGIEKLKPARYHELTLQASADLRTDLRDCLVKVHKQGRKLIGAELEHQQGKGWMAEGRMMYPTYFDVLHKRNGFGPHNASCIGFECKCEIEHEAKCALKNGFPTCSCEFKAEEDEFDDLDLLTDVTDARVVNDVQSRITAAATRFFLLGLTGAPLFEAINNEVSAGSVSYIDRASRGVANRVISIGRSDEAQARSDEWDRIEYSCLLDLNSCEFCAADDGQSATDEADLTPTPNPDCPGECRCFLVYVVV